MSVTRYFARQVLNKHAKNVSNKTLEQTFVSKWSSGKESNRLFWTSFYKKKILTKFLPSTKMA